MKYLFLALLISAHSSATELTQDCSWCVKSRIKCVENVKETCKYKKDQDCKYDTLMKTCQDLLEKCVSRIKCEKSN